MILRNYIIVTVILIFCIWPGSAGDFDWPNWRGPERNSVSQEKNWDPLKLSGEPAILWKINVGNGYSSFAIVDNYLYTMGNKNRKDTVWCLNVKTGKEVWHYTYPCSFGQYPGPRSTPLIDGENMYTLSEKGDLFCFNAKTGKVIWELNIVKKFKAQAPTWNFAGSPVVEGDILYINACKYGIALNKKTGKKVWVSPPAKGGYSSPVICTIEKKESVLFFGEKAIYGVQRDNGKLLWQYKWITNYDVNAADPLVSDNKVFISSNYGVGCSLLQIKRNKPSEIWKSTVIKSHFSSFVLFDGYLYGNDGSPGSGRFKCIKLSDGKEMWSEKLGFGSLMATKDYLIMLTERGTLHIVKVNPKKYEEIAQAKVLNNTCWTPPVLCSEKIYCRNHRGDIVCVDVSKDKKK